MKRLLDLLLCFIAIFVLIIPLFLIFVLILFISGSPVIYWSDRVGRDGQIFRMPKFRTMQIDTPDVASHLLANPCQYLIPMGSFLRKSSLDELPQLWNILTGEMSFVGPRPALFNQEDLIALRAEYGVNKLTPGLTGWAQVNGRDELSVPSKVQFDVEYLKRRSFCMDVKILGLTILKIIRRTGVTH